MYYFNLSLKIFFVNLIIYDTAIIGAGPVGLFAIFQAGMLELNTCILDSLSTVGGQCATLYPEKYIYDIPAFYKISAKELINNLKKQASPFPCSFYLQNHCKMLRQQDGFWCIETNERIIVTKTIVIAAGAGSLNPKKIPIKSIEQYEEKSIFYHIKNKYLFEDQVVSIAGGGDSALDWVITLAEDVAKKVYLIHRRNNFRGSPRTVSQVNKLIQTKKVQLITPYQIDSISGKNGMLTSVKVKNTSGDFLNLSCSYLLAFFGMSVDIGAMKKWGLKTIKNKLEVNCANMSTNLPGIFAIGDVCHYREKIKLISIGFAESVKAMRSVYSYIYPEKKTNFKHSTITGVPKE